MDDNDKVVALLASIDRRLALLTAPQERDLRTALVNDLLRSASRVAMFDGIDGRRGSPELAKLAGVSERSAQLFIKELLDLGLVRESGAAGRGVRVERDEAGILAWFLRRDHRSKAD